MRRDVAMHGGAWRSPWPVVGLGVSDADHSRLEALFSGLSPTGVPYLVAANDRGLTHETLHATLVRCCRMAAVVADGQQPLEPDKIYLLPSKHTVRFCQDELRLSAGGEARGTLPLDHFFGALAHSLGSQAAGVLVAGSGTDGLHGLRSIAQQGGAAFALSDGESEGHERGWDAVPRSSVATLVSPRRLVSELQLWRSSRAGERPDEDITLELYDRLERAYALDFSGQKPTVLQRQMAARMAKHALERPRDYLALLDAVPDELAALRAALLVGSTRFFRDRELFDALASHVLPGLLARCEAQPVRAWVAGCSTGQEAYSLAITISEALTALGQKRAVRIYATDVRPEALREGRTGIYDAGISRDLSRERLERFFVPCGDGFRVHERVRNMVLWSQHDLLRNAPYSHMDIVSCRNLLLYFGREAQRRALTKLHFALRPTGALLLGSAESTLAAEQLFVAIDATQRIYARRGGVLDASKAQELSRRSAAGGRGRGGEP